MIKLGTKQRERLSGMLANFAQITLGALLVSNFFKEGNGWMRLLGVSLILTWGILSVIIEPNGDHG